MKVILLSDFHAIPHEHELLIALFERGLKQFHLRKRTYTREQTQRYLECIPAQYHPHIVIHNHFDLLESYELKGLHFCKKYTVYDYLQAQQLDAASLRKKYGHISHSLHSLNDIQTNTFPFDYLFLSPVFDSISNVGYNSKIKIQTIRKFFKEVPDHPQVIAVSGITDQKVSRVFEAGFSGLALLGYIWVQYKEDQNLQAAIERFQRIQRKIEQLPAAYIY